MEKRSSRPPTSNKPRPAVRTEQEVPRLAKERTKAEDKTVGRWLEETIQEWTEREGDTKVNNGLSLRKLATVLGASQPFLLQVRAGKRPLPEVPKRKAAALGAYHLLVGDKQNCGVSGKQEPVTLKRRNGQLRKVERAGGFEPPAFCLGSKHSTTELRPLVIVAA